MKGFNGAIIIVLEILTILKKKYETMYTEI